MKLKCILLSKKKRVQNIKTVAQLSSLFWLRGIPNIFETRENSMGCGSIVEMFGTKTQKKHFKIFDS